MTKLNPATFEKAMGTWWPKIKPFFMKGGLDGVYSVLKEEGRKGIKIVPKSDDTFRAFRETPIRRLRAVVMGFCPYHSVVNGVPVADGLAMSCSRTGILQPSLENFYDALEEEFNNGLCLECGRNSDLAYLAHQGVLLFNSALTTHVGQPGKHQDLWEPFTAFVLGEIIALTGVPVVLLGHEAREFSGLFPAGYPVFELSHPASVSYGKPRKWSSEGVFTKVNEIIKGSNGEEQMVEWMMELAPF